MHRLALALGWSVEQVENQISEREFRAWVAYAQLEPFGQDYLHLMLARVCSMLAGLAGQATSERQFMPGHEDEEPDYSASDADQIRQFEEWLHKGHTPASR